MVTPECEDEQSICKVKNIATHPARQPTTTLLVSLKPTTAPVGKLFISSLIGSLCPQGGWHARQELI